MNTETIPARKVAFGTGLEKPGDFCFADDLSYIYLWLPGSTGPDALRIVKGSDPGADRWWGWDGDEDKPTLTPSILDPGKWHGYLRIGVLQSC